MTRCLSVTSWCSVEMDGPIELVLAGVEAFFQPHRTRRYKEIQDFQVSTTVRVLQSGILSSTLEIVKILPWHVDHPNVLST